MTRQLLLRLFLIAAFGLNVVAVVLTRHDTTTERTETARPPPIVHGCFEPGSEQQAMR
jgi:hypothetical protein